MTIQSMNITEPRGANNKHCLKGPYKRRTKIIIGVMVVLVFLSALAGYFIAGAESKAYRMFSEPPDPIEPLKPSASHLHVFRRSAVCTDSPQCSQIGREILEKNGSAVDAAIAAMFCNGLMNMQSTGIGGGFFMTVYIKEEGKAYTVNAREKAPAAATTNMFRGMASKASKGSLACGVPGEVRGMWIAHQRWGKLPWYSLIAPTIKICEEGYPISTAMHQSLEAVPYIKNDVNLGKMYFSPTSGRPHRPGTIVKPSENLCNTLKRIATNGGDDFYNGSLAYDLVEDFKSIGSIITAEDLAKYEAKITEPLTVTFNNGDKLYTPPLPSSGIILIDMINIMSSYNFTPDSINTTDNKILTKHRMIEAMKYSYAHRTKFGDADFLDVKEIMETIMDPEYGEKIRLKINDTMTSNSTDTYGASEYNQPDSGTAHISIIGNNGDAVSITSSINYYFGAGLTALQTGVVLNNVMDDFSSPGITNYFGVKPSPANFIAPGKRPMSSMSPTIIIDRSGNAKLVIGASGGTKITTSTVNTLASIVWFGKSIKEAIDEPRIHHQILPMYVEYEYGNTEDLVNGLRAKGHGMVRYRGRGSVVCALYQNETGIYGNADYRKGGDVSGMN